MPAAQVARFSQPKSPMDPPLSVQIGQFFMRNVGITLTDIFVQDFEGASRGQSRSVVIVFRTGLGQREPYFGAQAYPSSLAYFAEEFIDEVGSLAEDKCNAFLAADTNRAPFKVIFLSPKARRFNGSRRLLLIYYDQRFASDAQTPSVFISRPLNEVQPGATESTVNMLANDRANVGSVAVLGSYAWRPNAVALVTTSINAGEMNSRMTPGCDCITRSPVPVDPTPPDPVTEAVPCDCCYRLTGVGYSYGEATCTHDWRGKLIFDQKTAFSGASFADIVRAAVKGYVTVSASVCSGACGGKWAWPDPLHYRVLIDGYFDNGFTAVIAFEDFAPACADFDYNDSFWVLEFTRAAPADSPSCVRAPSVAPIIPAGF
jgi:hypothetical protein